MGAELVVSLILGLVDRAGTLGALLTKGKAEGWTDERWKAELDALAATDDSVKRALDAEIAKQK